MTAISTQTDRQEEVRMGILEERMGEKKKENRKEKEVRGYRLRHYLHIQEDPSCQAVTTMKTYLIMKITPSPKLPHHMPPNLRR